MCAFVCVCAHVCVAKADKTSLDVCPLDVTIPWGKASPSGGYQAALLRDSSVLSATSPPRPSVLCSVAHCCHTVLLNWHYTRHIHKLYILFSLFVCTTYGAKQCGWLLFVLIHTLFLLNAESLYLTAEPQIHCFLAITKIIANYNSAILCHVVSTVGDNVYPSGVFWFHLEIILTLGRCEIKRDTSK